MKIYKISDDEWGEVFGEGQLKEFATRQVLNCEDDFLEENIKEYNDNWEKILKLVDKIINDEYVIKTLEEANLIFQIRIYNVEEIEVY